jgi:hypothetical protein
MRPVNREQFSGTPLDRAHTLKDSLRELGRGASDGMIEDEYCCHGGFWLRG